MATYRVLPGETFGVSDQFKAGDTLPANYLTDEEAQVYLGYKLEVVPFVPPAIEVATWPPAPYVADASPAKTAKSK